jgi:hypothetical protein
MAKYLNEWSNTPGSNNFTQPDGWPEGITSDKINNIGREIMAVHSRHEKDTNGSVLTTGTQPAYVVTLNQTSIAAYYDGLRICLDFHAANAGGAATINVNAIGAKALQWPDGTAVGTSEIILGMKADIVYDGTQFQLLSPASSFVELSGDASPQLGGALDPNGNLIGMDKGGDIASATNMTIDTDGDYFDITGTTTMTDFTVAVNRHFFTQFDGALILTHDGTKMDLPGEANITTAAGDVAEWFSHTANQVQCVNYTRADGTAIIPSVLEFVKSDPLTLATTIEVNNLAAGFDYIITLEAFAPTTDIQALWLRFSDDLGVSFEAGPGDYQANAQLGGGNVAMESETEIALTTDTTLLGNDAGNFNTVQITLINPNAASENTTCFWNGFIMNDAASVALRNVVGGAQFLQGVNAIEDIQFLWSGGSTFKAQGDISVWRRKRS